MEPIPARNYSRLPLAERLEAAHVAIDALETDPEIQAALAPLGYDAARITTGRTLVDTARTRFDAQRTAEGRQRQSTQQKSRAFQDAETEFRRLANIADVAFRDDPATRTALGTDNLPDRQAEKLARFRQFSTVARDPAHLATLTPFGITEPTLDAFDTLVTAADTTHHAAEADRAAAQDATHGRDNDVDDLDRYMRDLHDLARVGLRDRPQLLERLGLRQRS